MGSSKANDEKRRDEVLKRMLATPPKPHEINALLTKRASTKKGDDELGTRRRPAKNKKITSSSSKA